MENFIFSVNATMPVFMIIAAGFVLRRIGLIKEDFAGAANKFSFGVLFPVLLFRDISQSDISKLFGGGFAAFCFISTIIYFAAVRLLAGIFIKNKKSASCFSMVSCRGSAAILGIAFAENIYGSSGMVPVMIIASVPLYNIFSVLFLAQSSGEKPSVGKIARDIITNPMIVGIFAGLPFAALGITLPDIIQKPINSIASMASPLALIALGADFKLSGIKNRIGLSAAASFIKLVLLPAVIIPAAALMGFRGEELIAVLIMSGAPTTVAAAIMAYNMNSDYALAQETVVITTVLSAVTITAAVFIMRTAGVI